MRMDRCVCVCVCVILPVELSRQTTNSVLWSLDPTETDLETVM